MPIYEYRCDDCGTEFEKRVNRVTDSTSVACPSCGEMHLTQKLSTFAPHVGGTRSDGPMCPSGGVCPTPGMCGQN